MLPRDEMDSVRQVIRPQYNFTLPSTPSTLCTPDTTARRYRGVL